MAKGKKTGGKDFEKGKSGNLDGRPPTPPDIKRAAKLTQVELERTANKFLPLTRYELRKILKSKDTSVLDLMVARVIYTAVWTADQKRLGFVLDRLIGRPRTQPPPVPDGDESDEIKKRIAGMTDEELDKRFDELVINARKK